jgi:hypothetical protein
VSEQGSPGGRRHEPIVAAFERLSGSVATLIRDHVELAKIEMRDAVRVATQDAVTIGTGVAVLVVGHGLLMTGLTLGLAHLLPTWAAFVIVGGVNLGAGTVLIRRRVKLIRTRHLPVVAPLPAIEAPSLSS